MWYSCIVQGVLAALEELPSWYTSVFLIPITTPFLLFSSLTFRSLPVTFQNPEGVVLFVTFFFGDVYSFGEMKYHTGSFVLIIDNAGKDAGSWPQMLTSLILSSTNHDLPWIHYKKEFQIATVTFMGILSELVKSDVFPRNHKMSEFGSRKRVVIGQLSDITEKITCRKFCRKWFSVISDAFLR